MLDKIGFTGTRMGMSERQLTALRITLERLRSPKVIQFHHGDCTGADDEAHRIAEDLEFEIWVHPPSDTSKAVGHQGHQRMPAKDYMARNWDIVMSSELLIAAPRTNTTQQRSGTWATVRRADDHDVPVIILRR